MKSDLEPPYIMTDKGLVENVAAVDRALLAVKKYSRTPAHITIGLISKSDPFGNYGNETVFIPPELVEAILLTIKADALVKLPAHEATFNELDQIA